MDLERFQRWDGRGVFLLRLDYGYAPADLAPTWPESPAADLARQGWLEGARDLSATDGSAPSVLAGADRLLDLARRRTGAILWREVARIGLERGLLLWVRFPRAAAGLASALESRGLLAGSDSWEPSGQLPPLYQRLGAQEELLRLHRAHEWETGLAHARATTVLVEAAARMAQVGELAPSTLSAELGTSTGAARSYLRWMAEAGLARRTPSGYALRHPGLGRLFLRPEEEPPSPLAPPPGRVEPQEARRAAEEGEPPPRDPMPQVRRWVPDEMD